MRGGEYMIIRQKDLYLQYPDYMYHHGIKGMKWGIRRFQDKSGRRTAAGKKRYTEDNGKEQESKSKFKLTDKQKKYIKIGAAAVATALVAYGGYKIYQHNIGIQTPKMHQMKKNLGKKNLEFLRQIDKGKHKAGSLFDEKVISSATNGFKKVRKTETLAETLSKVNPLRGNPEYKNNCTACSLTTFMRRLGYDVSSKSTGGEGKNLGGLIEECFKGARVIDGSAGKFGKSKADASEMLIKKFGQNASGVCSIQWIKGAGGHAFNWEIKDGIVSFFDGQSARDDNYISNYYFKLIDKAGSLTLARLDNAEINFEALAKYIRNS